MGPDAIQRATARSSAALASLTRACLTSLHQFLCPAAVHSAKVAGEDDVPNLPGKAATYYYLEKGVNVGQQRRMLYGSQRGVYGSRVAESTLVLSIRN